MGRIILTLCGLVAALGLAGASPPYPIVKEAPARVAEASAPQVSQTSPSQTLTATIVESPAEAERRAQREASAARHDAENLDAQIRAADAAEEQVIPAWAAAILSFFGTVLILWSLGEARAANKIARDALVAAEKATKTELRAYLYIDRAEVRWGNQVAARPQISLWVINAGQTPAQWFGISVQVVATNDELGVDEEPFDGFVFDPASFLQWPALGGNGASLSVPGSRQDDTETLQRAFNEGLAVQVFGVLLYETIDGELMESEFWFVSRPPHRFAKQLKEGVQANTTGLATFGMHEEVPRKMSRASRMLKVFQPSMRNVSVAKTRDQAQRGGTNNGTLADAEEMAAPRD